MTWGESRTRPKGLLANKTNRDARPRSMRTYPHAAGCLCTPHHTVSGFGGATCSVARPRAAHTRVVALSLHRSEQRAGGGARARTALARVICSPPHASPVLPYGIDSLSSPGPVLLLLQPLCVWSVSPLVTSRRPRPSNMVSSRSA
jgi:hypothetical protein